MRCTVLCFGGAAVQERSEDFLITAAIVASDLASLSLVRRS